MRYRCPNINIYCEHHELLIVANAFACECVHQKSVQRGMRGHQWTQSPHHHRVPSHCDKLTTHNCHTYLIECWCSTHIGHMCVSVCVYRCTLVCDVFSKNVIYLCAAKGVRRVSVLMTLHMRPTRERQTNWRRVTLVYTTLYIENIFFLGNG